MAGGNVLLYGEKELFAKLDKLGRELAGVAKEEALKAGAEVVKAEAEARANGDPGIVIEIKDNEAIIGPDKDHWHWRFAEYGASIHIIRPKKKEVLANKAAGKVFGKKVSHPGVRKKPFLRPALDENADKIQAAMAKVLAQALK